MKIPYKMDDRCIIQSEFGIVNHRDLLVGLYGILGEEIKPYLHSFKIAEMTENETIVEMSYLDFYHYRILLEIAECRETRNFPELYDELI